MLSAKPTFIPTSLAGGSFYIWLLTFGALVATACAPTQGTGRAWVVDEGWVATRRNQPTYGAGNGPTVWVDEAHNNMVATTGRFAPFVEVLEADGYVVKALRSRFTRDAFAEVQLLVIGNALGDRNVEAWQIIEGGDLPTTPIPTYSAFTGPEIDAIYEWVYEGGRLLLLADHMPFAGAAADLGHRFGLTFLDGFVEDSETGDPVEFSRSDGTLLDHPITRGFGEDTNIEFVSTFVGQAFRAEHGDPLMVLGPTAVAFQPEIPWDYDEHTQSMSVAGWLQGAVLEVGAGWVAIFGDSTMFSAQVAGDGRLMGMNYGRAVHNQQFLLNTMQWLVGLEGLG